jgi:putative ABC transport system ATP-binding protein
MNNSIQLSQVSKQYGEPAAAAMVLDRVSARFEPGEHVVIIGRSGSGKSTLLNLVGGLDLPSSGDVLFNGRSLVQMGEAERALLRRREIGFVFQTFNLIPTLTVQENLLVPLQLNGVTWADGLGRIAALMRRAGIGGCADRFPGELAGGEQQRAAVLRAIVHEPSVIIADEPTGNLDLDTARETLELLEQSCCSGGRTLIMATHSREVMGRAARVMRISSGTLERVDIAEALS